MALKPYETWKDEIENKIAENKTKGLHSLFYEDAHMTKETASRLTSHFEGLSEGNYAVEINRCASCLNKYEIIITWS